MVNKAEMANKVAKHPFVKKAITKVDLVHLTGKLADDDPMGEQLKDTLEVKS